MTDPPLSVVLLSHVASTDAPTGAERSLALLATGLVRRGHRVRFVIPGEWPLTESLTRDGVEVHTVPTRPCWLTYYEPRPWPIAAAQWLRWVRPQPGKRELQRLLGQWKPDVVHVNCLPHLTGADAARASGLPVVWHLREILPAGARRRWFARRLERDADRIVAVSEAVASWVRTESPQSPVEVVYNGVAPPRSPAPAVASRAELGIPADGVLVGLFGQLMPHKGVLDFVDAASVVLRSTRDARFVIAGQGPDGFVRRLDRAIRDTGQQERIHRVPARSNPSTLFGAADIVALTTRTPDPLPRAVLEAMAAGRPVVAYRTGGVPEMIDDGRSGLLVDVGEVDALARALTGLIGDAERRSVMGRAGAARVVEQFTLDRHVEQMERVLDAARR